MASAQTKVAKTEDQKAKEAVLANLSKLGGMVVGDDDVRWEGTGFVFPSSMHGDWDGVIRFAQGQKEQAEQSFAFDRTFRYRPLDGAHAFELATRRVLGTVGVGKPIQTLFGPIPPRYISVNVSNTETRQVPWGRVHFSPLQADFHVGSTQDREFGTVFHLNVQAPRKHRKLIEALFMVVEQELREHSIYRGKAITGAEEPAFIDTTSIDPNRVIYSRDVMRQLDTNMWAVLRYTDTLRKHGQEIKRACLVEGPYGTGKTLAGRLTAKEAVENGWTFILARPGKDDLNEVLNTAQLYAPSVVWYEDIDTVASGDNHTPISALLDSLDGITNKGTEILAGFTTNFVERLHKGVLRPGRLDAVIHIGEPTPDVYERLVKVNVPEEILGDVDFAKVAEAFKGFVPAFATEAIARAIRYAMSRNGGVPDTIETEDLVDAANGLRPQLALQESANEGAKVPTVDAALHEIVNGQVAELVNATQMVDQDGDSYYRLAVNGSK